jgi:ABC-type dipeptide/oligopeptide/nickel transport system ATPase component
MLEMKERRKGASILLITHNLAVVAETCDRVAVMYGGKIQEIASIDALFDTPFHPYTHGLLGSIPSVDGTKARRLTVIPWLRSRHLPPARRLQVRDAVSVCVRTVPGYRAAVD